MLPSCFQSQISVFPLSFFPQSKQSGTALSLLVLFLSSLLSPPVFFLSPLFIIKQPNTLPPAHICFVLYCYCHLLFIAFIFQFHLMLWHLIDWLSHVIIWCLLSSLLNTVVFWITCLLVVFWITCLLFHSLLIWPQFSPAPLTLRINCANNWLQLAKRGSTVVYKQSSPPENAPAPSRTAYDHLGRGVWPWISWGVMTAGVTYM